MTTAFKGASISKSELNAYSVGIMRLNEAHITNEKFNRDDIKFIGWCSINRREVTIGKIGNFWCIRGRSSVVELKVQARYGKDSKFKAYYIVKGKHVTVLHPGNGMNMNDFECRELSKPLHMMSSDEIFRAGKGTSCPKHGGKANSHADIGKYKNKPYVSLSNYGY